MSVAIDLSTQAFGNVPTIRVALREATGPASTSGVPTRCSICGVREACLTCDLLLEKGGRSGELIVNDHHVGQGGHLYRTGDAFTALYTVRSGFFKTVQTLEVGREQVTGFHMAGDMLGADGIGSEVYGCDAIALEDSHVCVVPYSQIMKLGRYQRELRYRLQRAMSGEIVRKHNIMLLLGTRRTEERLAAFLLNLSERFAARGYSATEFFLRMTRREIASYLGMNDATVSRHFSKFQSDGLISVQNKHVRICDIAGLMRCLNCKTD
ncbi:MAG TPA: helix-turn-helix domain-containing protein [Burkholderiaceae bacterium]|nr:helix-turn-helix domain-containing protein [Burkholderiaceae bacterium]